MHRSIVSGAFLSMLIALSSVACGPPATMDPGPPSPIVEYVQRQEILTPLPLRVRLPRSTGTEHVVVLVHTWGSRGWKGIELARSGQTWTGEVSCREVSTVTGDTKYFFVALDAEGNLVGGSGTPDWPHVATIVGKLPDGAQALPGGTAPRRCHDVADCPPDFPGCPAYAMKRKACQSDSDCGEKRCAWDGYCGAASLEIARNGDDDSEEEQLETAVRWVKQRYRKTASASSPSRP